MPSFRPAAVTLLCAALIAGCGGSNGAKPSSPVSPKTSQPTTDGQLSVGGTSINLGDATTGSSGGVQVLPDTKVPADQEYREGVGAGASCENTDLVPTPENIDQVVESTLCLLNGERADHGLQPLAQDDELGSAARAHTLDMLRAQYFDHIAPDGSTPVDRIRRSGYIPADGSWIVGENLAWGTGTLASPKGIMKAWMNSEGHRANILRGSFNHIGFGVFVGNPSSKDGEGATYTTTFGGKSGTTPAAAPKPPKRARGGKRKARKARAAAKARKAKARKARISLQ
jgi:uncharacterized protein YkwD